MSIFSKDHYELMTQFEKDFRHMRLDKEPKELWASKAVYRSGETNNMFLAYRAGVSYGKTL